MTLADLPPLVPATRHESAWDVLDALPIHIASVDRSGTLVAANRAWREFGHAPIGGSVLDGWDGDRTGALVRSTLRLGIGEVLAGTRTLFEMEYPRRLAHETVWFALSAHRWGEGAVVSQRDVTVRRRADARRAQESAAARTDHALARAGSELITSLELPEVLARVCRLTADLLDCDTSHTILWQEEDESYTAAATYGESPENEEIIRALRIPRAAFVGAVARGEDVGVGSLEFPDAASAPLGPLTRRLRVRRLLQIGLKHGDRLIGFQTACRRNDEPFGDEEERLAARLGQLASLAIENARLVSQLGEASRLKSEFVATVSHELRTPIHVVLGFADLLIDGEFGELSKDQTDAVNRILFGARDLLELSEAAMQVTRLDAGQVPLKIQDIDVAKLFTEVEAEVKEAARATSVPVESRIAPGVERIESDRGKLKLILKNLLGNGLKFTPEGNVTMSARRRGDDVVLVVKDTGVGIPDEALPTIFDPFRQADGSTARRYGGVGLGLHIVRRAAERLGGTVRAQSTVGEGSRFEVVVPGRTRVAVGGHQD